MNAAPKNAVEVYLVDLGTKMIRSVPGDLLIGRCEGELQYPCDSEMSRRHLRIVILDNIVLVEDLGSTNGTRINGVVVKQYAPNQVNSGDVIEIGAQRLMLRVQPVQPKGVPNKERTTINLTQAESDPAPEVHAEPPVPSPVPSPVPTPMPLSRPPVPPPSDPVPEVKAEPAPAPAPAFTPAPANVSAPLEVEGREKEDSGVRRMEGVILPLTFKKSAWYVLFETSEFGPFSLDELNKVLDSPMFQAAPVCVWAEGMEDWCPVEIFRKLAGGKDNKQVNTAKVARSARLLASVVCHVIQNGEERLIEGDCEEIGNLTISVFCPQRVASETDTFQLDVNPLPNVGLDKFSVKVRLEKSAPDSKTQLLVYVNMSPTIKMKVEKYIDSKKRSDPNG